MKTLILFDSYFGNTEQIANAVALAFDPSDTISKRTGEASASDLDGVTHLIIGSPTRGFRPTEATQKFIKEILPSKMEGISVAVFDTRIVLETIKGKLWRYMVDKGGYASNTMAKQLIQKKATLLVPAEGFYVTGEQGPLKEGETERATAWGRNIVNKGN